MEMTASYDAAFTAGITDNGSASGPGSDDPAIAELFADAARRGAVLRRYLHGVVFDFAGDGAEGPVADLSVRRPGNVAAGLGAARDFAPPPLLADHHGDRGAGRGGDSPARPARAGRVSAALGAG